MKWYIVADSSCDLVKEDFNCEAFGFTTVPFTLRIGDREYVDGEELDTEKLLEAMEGCAQPGSTACPSPHAWSEEFEKAENIISVTISDNLSGSYNSAVTAMRLLDGPSPRRIAVLNSRSTGPALALLVQHIAEMIHHDDSFDSIREKAENLTGRIKTVFALNSFDNLVKNGRMGKLTGFIAKRLGMWGIGIASPEGTIHIKGKTRGVSGAISTILDDLHQRGFSGQRLVISHCHNSEFVQALHEGIKGHWPEADITVLKTRGLDSFYAERGGVIVSYL